MCNNLRMGDQKIEHALKMISDFTRGTDAMMPGSSSTPPATATAGGSPRSVGAGHAQTLTLSATTTVTTPEAAARGLEIQTLFNEELAKEPELPPLAPTASSSRPPSGRPAPLLRSNAVKNLLTLVVPTEEVANAPVSPPSLTATSTPSSGRPGLGAKSTSAGSSHPMITPTLV